MLKIKNNNNKRLPFGHENNCALGLVLKYHLQHYKDAGYNTSLLKTKFPACYDPLEDLKRGTNFWESVSVFFFIFLFIL